VQSDAANIRNMDKPDISIRHFPGEHSQLRIALVTETYPPEVNGVAMTLGRMVDGLLERGHAVQLVRPRQNPLEQPSSGDQLEEVLASGMAIPRYAGLKLGLPAKRALTKLWSVKRPDIVHVVTEGPLGSSAIAAAQKLKLPVTSDFHTNFHRYSGHYGMGWLQRPIAAYLRKFHNRTATTFVPTAALVKELAAEGYRDLEVIARGVDTELFSPARRNHALRAAWGAEDGAPVAITVGRMAAEKNLPLVLAAFAALKAQHPLAKLVFVGDGPARNELEGRHPEHIYAGMRTGVDLAQHYASADIFLFPSLTETYGNVTAEAMASGLAVVAYDYAAAAELIAHQQNGLLAPCGDEAAFIACAVDAAAALSLTPLRRQARQSVLGHDWERIHDAFASALATAVRNHERKQYANNVLVVAPD
jgi:glycosyltransferase involved in cell wall biosynthesis